MLNVSAFPVPAFPALGSAALFRKSKDSLPGLLSLWLLAESCAKD